MNKLYKIFLYFKAQSNDAVASMFDRKKVSVVTL